MKLVVTRMHHTHAGKTYRVGDTFEGSERLLAVFSDRLAKADQQIKTSVAPDDEGQPKRRGRPKKVKNNGGTTEGV